MSVKNISLNAVGTIWLLVGLGLSFVGIQWLIGLGVGPKLIIFLTLSIIVGALKGKFVLQKTAFKYYKRADVIEFNNNDILLGWIKILGIKGFILIGLMMGLGSFLRHSSIDRPILGVLYLAVGIALLYASKVFFNCNKVK